MRLTLLLTGLAVGGSVLAQPATTTQAQATADTVTWHTVSSWGVEGRGWDDVERYYDRLPRGAKGVVRDKVWDLSRHSAGISCRFRTRAPEIHVRYLLLNPRIEMAHMPATGVSGVDLYVLDGNQEWRWVATAMPSGQRVSTCLIRGMPPEERTFMLYLPLYNGVDSLDIGVPRGTSFEGIPPRTEKPVVFYGTSIMHGACASRPGMAIPAILGRRLNVPTLNLGFSGNGRFEPEVGRFLTEIDAGVYVLDCLPNLSVGETAQRTEPMVRQLREARPTVPIVMVEDRVFPNSVVLPERMAEHRQRHEVFRAAYVRLVAAGVQNLQYLQGDNLLGEDGEATVDGSHPTDLGMMRYAEAYEKVLRPLINKP